MQITLTKTPALPMTRGDAYAQLQPEFGPGGVNTTDNDRPPPG